jgi:hypothetical protein
VQLPAGMHAQRLQQPADTHFEPTAEVRLDVLDPREIAGTVDSRFWGAGAGAVIVSLHVSPRMCCFM